MVVPRTYLNALLALSFVIFEESLVRAQEDYERPCGFKISPCPQGSTCSAHDPSCPATRGENFSGTRVTATPRTSSTGPTPTETGTASQPTTSRQYEDCGGERLIPKNCPEG